MEIISRPKSDIRHRVAAGNAAIWAETFLRNERGEPWSFANHIYQLEWMVDVPRVWSLRKGTQVGGTLAKMAHVLYLLNHGVTPQGMIVLFPTDKAVSEFSQTRWTPWLANNIHYLSRMVRSTNNIHNKRIGNANLMFRGAKLTSRVGGIADDSAALRSDPADGVLADEFDLHPVTAHGMAMGRCEHSQLQLDWALANPTIPNYGIDKRFADGDQRYWMTPCHACNQWWAPDYEFPQIMQRQADGSVVLACIKCGRRLDVNDGQWVAFKPERSKDHVSYQASLLIRPDANLKAALDAYEDPPDGDLATVMRFKFGKAYIDSSLALSTQDVLLCCTTEPMWTRSLGGTAIGVDIGKHHHVVIGRRLGPDVYQIGALLIAEGWGHLKQIFEAFSCQVASIDNEPEIHAARQFQREFPAAEVWLSDYVASVRGAAYDHNAGLIRVNRNEILDETHHKIVTAGKLRLPAANAMVQDFADQCANLVKVIERKTGTGDAVVTYLQRGPDHWRHAFANFLLAAHRQVPVTSKPTTTNVRQRATGGFNLFES